jgi:endonuclease/exonuclease/phosphatase family metal-dependent hydrolase
MLLGGVDRAARVPGRVASGTLTDASGEETARATEQRPSARRATGMGPRPRLRSRLLVAVLAVGPSQCHRPLPPRPAPAEAPALRIMTFNVNFGVAEHADNLAAIHEAAADVVLLQETTPAAEEAMRGELAERYPHMVFTHCCRAGGLAVLSRFPILEREPLPATVSWFPAERVVIQAPLGRVQLLNVHLRPPLSESGSWISGYFSTRSIRREEIETYWQHIDPSLPTVVAGDFNEAHGGEAVEYLADHGLRSVLPEREPRAKTWHWRTAVGTIHAQLDHIVVDRRLACIDVHVLERGRSDHYPIVADLAPAR